MMNERRFNHTGFNAYLSEQRLMGSRCRDCGEVLIPPRAMCPRCYGTDMEWMEFSGKGELAGYTIVFIGLPEMATAGYSRETPYVSGIVRLAEGPAISGQILADDLRPEDIQVGMPVQVCFIERTSGATQRVVLAFEKVALDPDLSEKEG